MWKKEKMLVASIFSFSNNVFKRLLSQGHEKSGLCGKELMHMQKFSAQFGRAFQLHEFAKNLHSQFDG